MDQFEKDMARKQLKVLKTINRNINYLGRKLEATNDILQKNGITVMPTVETEKAAEYEAVVRVSDIKAWKDRLFNEASHSSNAEIVGGFINLMMKDLSNDGKILNIDIQKGE